MKVVIISLSLFTLFSCNKTSSGNDTIEKLIKHKIEKNGWGVLKDIELQQVDKINDTAYHVMYTFHHPMLDKDVRMTKEYYFQKSLDSVYSEKDLKKETKVDGDWVKHDLF